jgi:hypothetical protein
MIINLKANQEINFIKHLLYEHSQTADCTRPDHIKYEKDERITFGTN